MEFLWTFWLYIIFALYTNFGINLQVSGDTRVQK